VTHVIEANEYREARAALAADPIVRAMAAGLAGVARDEIAYEDGAPRGDFYMAALREYQKRGGKVATYGMGDVGHALLMILDGKA
jgi:hypothetical protein